MPNLKKLIAVFEEAHLLLSKPENDFVWSFWEDSGDALQEVDGILANLRSGVLPTMSSVLFAPTGPLQEVSLSSGWGQEFLALADRFDEAMASETCACLIASPRRSIVVMELGMDERYAEVSLLRCADCDQKWLRYFYENEAFTKSGRWYLGPISQEQADSLSLYNAKSMLEGLELYFYGGSYYEGQIGKSRGPIHL